MISKKNKKINGKVNSACVIATYFGFEIINAPNVTKEHVQIAENIRKKNQFIHNQLPPVEEIIALIDAYDKNPEMKKFSPSMIYYEGQAPGNYKKKRKKSKETILNLHIIGSNKSIAEAILIKIANTILEEEGYKELMIDINSIGGKESIQLFNRELNQYFRKQINSMPLNLREMLKESPYALMQCDTQSCKNIKNEVPLSITYLNDMERKDFREVIEHIESQELDYMMNKDCVGDPFYSTHTIFQITDTKKETVIASGCRYNLISKKVGIRKPLPATMITLNLNGSKKVGKSLVPSLKNSKFYFIQLAFDAKLKSLQIIDVLRKAKIPVFQSLSRDKISSQLETAKKLKFPYILIMGQKEAIDNTIIVRNVSTHSQVSIDIKNLVDYLKKLK